MARRPPPHSADRVRCGWSLGDPLYRAYHDEEWGVPLHDDRRLFELLCLEGAQAGLAWITILRKRAGYRRAFDRFDPRKIAGYGAAKVRALLADPGIVRNRLKVHAAIENARAYLALREELGSFDRFVWSFVEGAPRSNAWQSLNQVPPRTSESDAMSKALRQRGFSFVGSTICYAFMQSAGLVNDHVIDCFRHAEIRDRTSTSRQFGPRERSRTGNVSRSESPSSMRGKRP